VEKGWDAQFGARPLKRAIQKYLEDPLAEEIIKSNIQAGDILFIDYEAEKDEVIVNARKPLVAES
jgi:ATP-dependent Clp protease ATP-binding subunit ClpC